MSVGSVLSEAMTINLFQAFPQAAGSFLVMAGVHWLVDASPQWTSAFIFTWSVSECPLFIRTPAILDEGPILSKYDLVLTNYICREPVSKYDVFWGNTVQPITPLLGSFCLPPSDTSPC